MMQTGNLYYFVWLEYLLYPNSAEGHKPGLFKDLFDFLKPIIIICIYKISADMWSVGHHEEPFTAPQWTM